MRLTSVLQVRNLIAKLHPPLPTTPRESQQLLNLLEKSFRKHLDEIHPAPQATASTSSHNNFNAPPDPNHASVNATNQYLDSILRHPLLSQNVVAHTLESTLTAQAVSRFENALLKTKLYFPVISQCTREYLRGAKNGEVVASDRKLASRIVTWFSTSSNSQKQAFLLNTRLLCDVIPVMYVDGLEEVVWNWLQLLYERDDDVFKYPLQLHGNTQPTDLLQVEDHFVSTMMKISIQRGQLNEAAQQYVQACEYRLTSGRSAVSVDKASPVLAFQPLTESWKRLSAAILYTRKRHGILDSTFDKVLECSIGFNYTPNIDIAFLSIYHPSSPSPQLLFSKLQSKQFTEPFLEWQEGLSRAYQKALLIVVIDAAQLFLDQNHKTRASWLLKFAEENYPKFISAKDDVDTQTRLASVKRQVEPQLWTNINLVTP